MKDVAKRSFAKTETLASVRGNQIGKEAINAAIELFNRRWVLRVLWELREQPMTFRGLQVACGDLSPTVLNTRLAELREAALVSHTAGVGYELTAMGSELLVVMKPLMNWAIRWRRTTT